MPVARLETIRRQLDPGLREAVTFASRRDIDQAIALLEKQGRVREVIDPNERHAAIAREFLAAHEAGERVLVVSPANDERRQLNAAIRAALKERGHITSAGREQIVLVNRELTRPQRRRAQSYEVGDILRFRRGSLRLDIDRGSYARVEAIDPERNQMVVRDERGKVVSYDPSRLSGVEVFHQEQRLLGPGDRIQFRAPDRALGVANGEFATVIAVDDRKLRLHVDNGREISAAIGRLKHIDYGYASTSHSSQGATVDRVIANIDTLRSAELVNRKQFYVSISRARHNVTLYTDDRARLGPAASRNLEKAVALERLQVTGRHGAGAGSRSAAPLSGAQLWVAAMISAPVRPICQRRCAVRADARAPQASPLGHAAQGAGRAPLRAAAAVALATQARRATGSVGRFAWHAVQRSAERILEFARSPKFG
jgi:ATP-dependent exoDNAse (exonuclease V) alpha subunit